MKKILKKSIKYIITYAILIVVFITSLTLVSLIPSEKMKDNVKETAEVLEKQGNALMLSIHYKRVIIPFDNYTDALMVNTAYSIDNKHPFTSFMLAKKNYIPSKTQKIYEQTVGPLKVASKYDMPNSVGELQDIVNGEAEEAFEYARYWHGYLVLLRPILCITNIANIRIVMTVVFIMLGVILTFIIAKKINILSAIAVALGLIYIDYEYIGITLQSTPVFLITMISSIIVAVKGTKIKHINLLFCIIGGLVCFTDFLTVPIISLGMPLTIYFLSLQKDRKVNLKEEIKIVFLASISWGIAYLTIWATKWILVDIIYDRGIIKTVLEQFAYRTSENKYTYLETLDGNFLGLKAIIIPWIIFAVARTSHKLNKI